MLRDTHTIKKRPSMADTHRFVYMHNFSIISNTVANSAGAAAAADDRWCFFIVVVGKTFGCIDSIAANFIQNRLTELMYCFAPLCLFVCLFIFCRYTRFLKLLHLISPLSFSPHSIQIRSTNQKICVPRKTHQIRLTIIVSE